MGLSASAVYISEPNVGVEAAIALGLVEAEASKCRDAEAGFIGGPGVRVATLRGWSVLLFDGGDNIELLSQLSTSLMSISNDRTILFWCTQSTVGLVWFEIHAKGSLIRRWVEAEGQVMKQHGEAVAEEAGLVDAATHEGGPLHDEWSMLRLVQAITGITEGEHFENAGPVYRIDA